MARRSEPWADLVGTFVVRDTDVPLLRGSHAPLSVVVTGGAGQVAGARRAVRRSSGSSSRASRSRCATSTTSPATPGGWPPRSTRHGRRARWPTTCRCTSSYRTSAPPTSWLAAADEVAAAELRLKFRTGGLEADAFPAAHALASWIDAALDRETPFKCTAGLHRAVRHTSDEGFEQHGFLNVMVATARAFDGAGIDDVVATLEERDGTALAAADRSGGRRWFASFGSCSIDEPLADLRDLGLVTL